MSFGQKTYPPSVTVAPVGSQDQSDQQILEALRRAVSGPVDAAAVRRLVRLLRRSLRFTRKGVTLSGQGLADLLLAVAPRLPVRDRVALEAGSGGMTGPALAGRLIRTANRKSAAVGGITGAMASAGELAPPFWVMLPVELVAETLLVAVIEMQLVAELHEVMGTPIVGSPTERGAAIVESWSTRRAIRVEDLTTTPGGLSGVGRAPRSQLVQIVRRKLMARFARNLSSLAPLLIGAVAGAEVNRRATRDLGDAVVRDLILPKER